MLMTETEFQFTLYLLFINRLLRLFFEKILRLVLATFFTPPTAD